MIVGKGGWSEQLAANKQAFLDAWVQRADFRAAYDGLADHEPQGLAEAAKQADPVLKAFVQMSGVPNVW